MNVSKCFLILLGALMLYACATDKSLSKATTAVRISVQDARQKVLAHEALLVCAYGSDELFNKMRLENALSYSEFNNQLDRVDKKQMIIFFCA